MQAYRKIKTEDSTDYHSITIECVDYFGVTHVWRATCWYSDADGYHKLELERDGEVVKHMIKHRVRSNLSESAMHALHDETDAFSKAQRWRAEVMYGGALVPWGTT